MQRENEYIFENSEKTFTVEEMVDVVCSLIENIVQRNGFLLLSVVPSMLNEEGIDYRKYAKSLKEFINKYFSDKYEIKQDYYINGRCLPNVLVTADKNNINCNSSNHRMNEDIRFSSIDNVFYEKKYIEYLRLIQEKCPNFNSLPDNYIDRVFFCANQLISPNETDFKLNIFQKELLNSRFGRTFIKKWKNANGYSNTILTNYEDSSICHFIMKNDVGLMTTQINNVGSDIKANNSFGTLISRFEACKDSLVFKLYTIRLCGSSSAKNIERTVGGYCAFLKELKTDNINQRIDFSEVLNIFERFLNIVVNEISNEPIDKNVCTQIISVYLDLNYQNRIPQILNLICKEKDNPLLIISDFIYNYKTWDRDRYSLLFGQGISYRIIEKICAYIWDCDPNHYELDESILRMLSYVLFYGGNNTLDEVVCFHCSKDYTKKQKEFALVNSFNAIISKVYTENTWLLLASYVRKYIYDNNSDMLVSDIDPRSVIEIKKWGNTVDELYAYKLGQIGNLSSENEMDYIDMFHLFEDEEEKRWLLQKKYNDWYANLHNWYIDSNKEQIELYLDEVYSKRIYFSFVFIFEYSKENRIGISDKYSKLYIDSLLQMNMYDKVIHFISTDEVVSREDKEKILIQTIRDNFTRYGLSEEAFLIFGGDLSINTAINVLQKAITPNKHSIIISLIILYAKNNELLKSAYLYVIYQKHTETGFTRIYSQIRKKYGKYFGKLHNHYEVCLKAFEALPYKLLLEFFRWTSTILIPNITEYNPRGNAFSGFVDELISNSDNVKTWKRFILHLLNHKEKGANQWFLCVTAIIAKHVFGAPSLGEVHDIIDTMIEEIEKNAWPENLLYYAARYIVDNDDEELCEKLYLAINNSNIVEKMLFENPWCYMNNQIDFFVDYCVKKIKETSDLVYFNLLTLIKTDLSGDELVKLSSFSVNKIFLLNRLCKYYNENKNQGEAIALLSNGNIWKNLTFQENELYNAVKLLYMSTGEIIDYFPNVFHLEEEVDRLKRDMVSILLVYPSQQDLFNFIEICRDKAHKLRVLSILYGVFCNEDIYNTHQYDYDEIISNNMEYEYLAFLKKCYISQLFYNSTYEYFYKLWRYFRLLIIECWKKNFQINDDEIITVMNRYQHYDMVMRLGYSDFKEILSLFVEDKSISTDNYKKCFLFCLLKEDFTILFNKYNNCLLNIGEKSKQLIGKMTSYLDFRDINRNLFNQFKQDLYEGKIKETFKTTKNLSESFSALVDVIFRSNNYKEDLRTIEICLSGSPAACVNKIISLDDDVYFQREELYVSIIGASQLAFKIYDRIRELLVKQKKPITIERYSGLAKYIDKLGYESSIAQFNHICALEYALKGDIEKLKKIISIRDAFLGIPVEWENENEKLIQYSRTNGVDKFIPDYSIIYIGAGQSKKGRITFVNSLCKALELDVGDRIDKEMFSILYDEYYDPEADFKEKSVAGLKLLYIIGKKYFKHSKNELPEYHLFAFEVGTLIASKESYISSELKILTLIDLFQNGGLTGSQKQTIYECFLGFFKELSLDQWINNYDSIAEIILSSGDIDGAEEISGLCSEIKKLAPGLLDTINYSSEELHEQLMQVNYIGQSVYSIAISRAVERRKSIIEKAIRLSIEIENENINGVRAVSDGYVYLCIRNIGNVSLNIFEDTRISLFLYSTDGTPYTRFPEVSGIKELRPNWLTGCRVNISKICESKKIGEYLEAKAFIYINDVLVCSKKETLIITAPIGLDSIPEPDTNGYYVQLAVGDNDTDHKVYGRTEEKKKIKNAISSGKAVIYGPSRIGKTSLLNWVIHSYAKEKKNIITILVGGEEGGGKRNDYVKNQFNNSLLIYEDSVSIKNITEYLLVEMFINGLDSINTLNPKQRRATFPYKLENEDREVLLTIIAILKQNERRIIDRYYDVDFILGKEGYEVWILFDEFQQVVENWKIIESEEPHEFIEVCECINERSITNIKFIFCGSDELLRQMVLIKNTSVWREIIFGTATGVKIGRIEEVKEGESDEYLEMIENDNAVKRPGLKYSDAALETICVYSDRVPLYGKEICNTILEEIKRISGIQPFGRNIIYSYDASVATQYLVELQNNYSLNYSIEESHRPRIVKIYDDVTKGLDNNTDKQYLWMMAEWFMEKPEKAVFDYHEYLKEKGYILLEGDSGLKNRLEIACVRGIIRGNEKSGYMFATPFYYSAFCGTIKNLNHSNILVKKELKDLEDDKSTFSKSRKENSSENDSDNLKDPKIISNIIIDRWADLGKIDENTPGKKTEIEKIKKHIGNEINTKQYISEGGTGELTEGVKNINNIEINIQNITNTLNGIIAAGTGDSAQILMGLSNLPRLEQYLPQIAVEGDYTKVSEERLSLAMENYVADMEESLEASDAVSVPYASILKISEEEYEELMEQYNLPEFFMHSLKFAYQLDQLFMKGAVGDDTQKIDFSPVTIMYCKLIESMLKEYHIHAYSESFENLESDMRKPDNKNEKYKWGDIGKLTVTEQQRLTIGSFVFPLYKKWAVDKIAKVTDKDPEMWKAHKSMVIAVKDIRNPSAHLYLCIYPVNYVDPHPSPSLQSI